MLESSWKRALRTCFLGTPPFFVCVTCVPPIFVHVHPQPASSPQRSHTSIKAPPTFFMLPALTLPRACFSKPNPPHSSRAVGCGTRTAQHGTARHSTRARPLARARGSAAPLAPLAPSLSFASSISPQPSEHATGAMLMRSAARGTSKKMHLLRFFLRATSFLHFDTRAGDRSVPPCLALGLYFRPSSALFLEGERE